jgi:hypothetical protein
MSMDMLYVTAYVNGYVIHGIRDKKTVNGKIHGNRYKTQDIIVNITYNNWCIIKMKSVVNFQGKMILF